MVEFISLLISYILMALADTVDTAFGNNISIDAVVVMGSMVAISQISKSFSRLGSYAYRILRKNEIMCLQIDLVAGSIVGLIIFLLRNTIINLFTLTPEQANLMKEVIIQWVFYIPAYAIGNTSFEIVRLNGKLKLYNYGLLIFYTILIATDAIVFFSTRSLPLLFATTTLCQIIVAVFFYIKMKYKFKLLSLDFIKEAIPYSIPIALERFINGLCHMFYGVLASSLGTIYYAIHSVCIGSISSAEAITNSYNAALMIKTPLNKSFKETRKSIFNSAKLMFPIMIILYIVYTLISLYIYRGNVSFKSCFPWFFTYMLSFFGLFCYENMKVLCAILKHVKAYPIGVIFGFTFRLGVSYIGLHTQYPLIFFGIAASFDWAIRGIVYYLSAYIHNRKLN